MAEQHGVFGRKYDFLEHLSIEDLEFLLRLSSDSAQQEAFFDAVTEVILKKEQTQPSGRIPDVDTAWKEFQTRYNTSDKLFQATQKEFSPTSDVQSEPSAHRPLRRIWRSAAIIAATFAATLVCMIGAQAAGLNVLGALASWTDETFHFVTTAPTPLQEALREFEMPEDLAPSHFPAGYELQDIESFESEVGRFVSAKYVKEDHYLLFDVSLFFDPNSLETVGYQKDTEDVSVFSSRGRKFYTFSNLEMNCAAWSDGKSLTIDICGNVPKSDIQDVICAIGG